MAMGNRPSLSLRKRTKNPKPPPATAAIPADLPQAAEQLRRSSPPINITAVCPELSSEKAQETPREDANEAALTSTNQESEGEDDEDPLQFFRRLSSNSEGGEGGERGSQDLFMSYTQALLLKQAGDYAAAR